MLNIKQDFIPASALKRPQIKQTVKYLTIHSTGNAKSTAQNERAYLTNPANKRQASFHVVVDDKQAIQCIPYTEVAYHAGDGQGDGNRASVGLEICESGDRAKTLKNAAVLAAKLLNEFNLPINKMVQHNHWSGKDCPRILRNKAHIKNNMDWAYFVGLVNKELAALEKLKVEIVLPDGKVFIAQAINDNGSNYVQVRPLLEALGYKVGWKAPRITVNK